MTTELHAKREQWLEDMTEIWDYFTEEFEPMPNPRNPKSFLLESEDAAILATIPNGRIWRLDFPYGQEGVECVYFRPDGYQGFDRDTTYGYIVTTLPWSDELVKAWDESLYFMAAVVAEIYCEQGCDQDESCDYCSGEFQVTASCLRIE